MSKNTPQDFDPTDNEKKFLDFLNQANQNNTQQNIFDSNTQINFNFLTQAFDGTVNNRSDHPLESNELNQDAANENLKLLFQMPEFANILNQQINPTANNLPIQPDQQLFIPQTLLPPEQPSTILNLGMQKNDLIFDGSNLLDLLQQDNNILLTQQNKKNRQHFHITDFFNLKKINYQLEFAEPQQNSDKKKLNIGQGILKNAFFQYKLVRKDPEKLQQILKENLGLPIVDETEGQDQKNENENQKQSGRIYIDLGFYSKNWKINQLTLIKDQSEEIIPLPDPQVFCGSMPSLQTMNPPHPCLPADIQKQMQAKTWYSSPELSSQNFKQIQLFPNLTNYETFEREINFYKNGEKKPDLHISKLFTWKLKKKGGFKTVNQFIEEYLSHEYTLKINVDGNLDATTLGLRAVQYKKSPSLANLTPSFSNDFGVYYCTQDHFGQSISWLPQIFGSTREPIEWTMEYITPSRFKVISPGDFISQKDYLTKEQFTIDSENMPREIFRKKIIHTYEIKSRPIKLVLGQQQKKGEEEQKNKFGIRQRSLGVVPDKIGFIVGDLPLVSFIQTNMETSQDQKGVIGQAFFCSELKQDYFFQFDFYTDTISNAIESCERVVGMKHFCRGLHLKKRLNEGFQEEILSTEHLLKIVFVPNLFHSKQSKQSLNFAGGIHIFDEEILQPRGVIEKRHKVCKILATGLSFHFFGDRIWEKSYQDLWLGVAFRERLGDRFRIEQNGKTLQQYILSKTMNKFYEQIENGSERFSLTSQFVGDFSEIEEGDNLFFWKCQILMHIVETFLGESHFASMSKELFKEASLTCLNLQLFKRVLKDFGIKFSDFQKNWLDATGCPLIICRRIYNKRNSQVSIKIEQHSSIKQRLLLKKHLDEAILGLNEANITQLPQRGGVLQAYIQAQIEKEDQEYNKVLSLEIESQRELRRFFTQDLQVVIYQTDGAEIQKQIQKIRIRYPKTSVSQNINLQCKVKRANPNHKKDDFMDDINNAAAQQDKQYKTSDMKNQQNDGGNERGGRSGTTAEQVQMMLNESNQWRFGMTNYEYEEYPERGTKTLFDVKNLDCPILWVRVDPDMECLRRVKVIQSKQSWLYQLLKEKDHLGQIEAIRELANYHDEYVYELLKSIAKNEKYFFKVRKHAIRSLQAINVAAFREHLSHEKFFLIKTFQGRYFNDRTGFYVHNNFANVIDYYMRNYLLDGLCASRESKLDQSQVNKKDYKNQLAEASGLVLSRGLTCIKEFEKEETKNMNRISSGQPRKEDADDEQEKGMKGGGVVIEADKFFNQLEPTVNYDLTRQFSLSSDLVVNLFLRLLLENDNSENAFDDRPYIAKLLQRIGDLDPIYDPKLMQLIAFELRKYMLIDLSSLSSPYFSIIKGSIKGYFCILKRLHRFQYQFSPLIYMNNQIQASYKFTKQLIEPILKEMQTIIEWIIKNQETPLDLKAFVYEQKLECLFLYTNPLIGSSFRTAVPQNLLETLNNILDEILDQIKSPITYNQFQGVLKLEKLSIFLEFNLLNKLNYKELFVPNSKELQDTFNKIQEIITCQETRKEGQGKKTRYWIKRLYQAIFIASSLPPQLQFQQQQLQQTILRGGISELDYYWSEKEQELQRQVDEQEELKVVKQRLERETGFANQQVIL